MRTSSYTYVLVFVLAASGPLAACDDNDENLAELRVVHAAPGAPAVDVFVDGLVVATGLQYGEASPFVELDDGDYSVIVRVSGTEDIVYETDLFEIDDNDRITAVAVGDVATNDPASSFRVLTLFEDFDDPDDAEARVRIVHASPDAPTVGIDVDNDGSVEIPGLTRFGDTGEDGVELPAGTSLQVGIRVGDLPLTAFTTPELPPSGELLVIAIGNVAALPRELTGFSLLVIDPFGVVTLIRQNPTVYALHASPDAPAVDIRADAAGANIFNALTFGEMEPVQVPPGDYTLFFFPAGDPGTTPVATAPVTGLLAGERYLAVATGMLTPVTGEQPFQVLNFRDEFVLDDNARIRAIHVSPDAPAVDISTATGTTISTPSLIRDLMFGESTTPGGLAVASTSSVRIGVAPTGSATALATFNLNTNGAPREYVLAAGALSPAPGEQSFRLFVVNTAISPWTITTVLPN